MIEGVNKILHTAKMVRWVVLTLLLTACGSGAREIRGELPLVRFEGLEINVEQARLDIGLRNVNDRGLVLRQITVELMIEDQPLLDSTHALDIDISARGRDVVSLRAAAQSDGRNLLTRRFDRDPADSAAPSASNAAWTMKLTLVDEEGRESVVDANGFLHPVPGRSGQYR